MTEHTTTGWDVLDQAHRALRDAVRGVAAGDWDRPTPCQQWSVTQVLQHAAGDQLAYVAALTGEGGPTENPFEPSGRLDAAPIAILDEALPAAGLAWAKVGHDAVDVPTPLPQGAMPAPTAVGACALDAAVHAWDIAIATGQPSPLDPQLARVLMPVASGIVEPLRAYGAYAAALEPASTDDDAAALLRYLGRRPDWVH
ncbi:MAG: hypothetical protein JWR06_1534 [Jatrophihabitans sp.]|jgi:uncharacterized protein (TIGR03086 family)|nr:hypothetical protein [Jatrophihabitans sp.]MDT4906739.1 hypothetical protein [Pseudonocardiales bacterium]